METNLVDVLLRLLSEKPPAVSADNTLLVITLVIAALTPILSAVATFISNAATRRNSEEAKTTADQTAGVVKTILTDVNSGKTAMIAEHKLEREKFLAEVGQLKNEILEISKKNATLMEQNRVQPSEVK